MLQQTRLDDIDLQERNNNNDYNIRLYQVRKSSSSFFRYFMHIAQKGGAVVLISLFAKTDN
jgi:hypothetical protein